MRVGQIMNKSPVTIAPDRRVGQALKLMQQHGIRHLPVVKGGRMLGWISARILREVLLASMLEVITVEDVMIEAQDDDLAGERCKIPTSTSDD